MGESGIWIIQDFFHVIIAPKLNSFQSLMHHLVVCLLLRNSNPWLSLFLIFVKIFYKRFLQSKQSLQSLHTNLLFLVNFWFFYNSFSWNNAGIMITCFVCSNARFLSSDLDWFASGLIPLHYLSLTFRQIRQRGIFLMWQLLCLQLPFSTIELINNLVINWTTQ